MIPRFRPLVGIDELRAFACGPRDAAIARFERAFAHEFDVAEAIAFPYGRTALRLLLETYGFRDRDVLCPAYTCVVVPHAIVASGNRPVFVDSGPDANMDLAAVARHHSARTAAIVPTSIFGHPVDLDALAEVTAAHPDLRVIQDCAHAFRCEWQGRPVHRAGHAAIYGMNISKIATSVFGGMVTTDDRALAARLREFRARRLTAPGPVRSVMRGLYLLAAAAAFAPAGYWFTDLCRRIGVLRGMETYYSEDRIDMPPDHLVGMTGLEAAVGAVQVARLGGFIAARRRYAAFYHSALADCAGLRFVPSVAGASFSHLAAVVHDRAALVAAARARGVELGTIVDYCIPHMAAYRDYAAGAAFPRAGFFAAHVVNLPLWGRFDADAAARVVTVMREILRDAPAAPRLPASPTE